MLYFHEKPPHAILAKEVIDHLHSDEKIGLTDAEMQIRFKKNGPNRLKVKKKVTAIQIFLRQFKSAIMVILIFAALVSYYLKESAEAYAISAIIVAVSIIGFYQEYHAENVLESIKKMVVTRTRVLRNKIISDVSSESLVVGDIIFLEAGDKVPADARIIRANELSVDESALTGESVPVEKADCLLAENTPLADRRNSIFMGCYVCGGNAIAIVTHTAGNTYMGMLAKEVPIEAEETPLQESIRDFGKRLSVTVILLGALLMVFELATGADLYGVLLISIAIAVSGIPESLPIIMTIGLVHGVHSMAKKNALVRRMDAVETLGCVTVICSDKTGTLTKNEMTVTKLYANDSVIEVSGKGYLPSGDFVLDGQKISADSNPTISRLLTAGVACNNARLKKEDKEWSVVGDPTEGSLIVLAKKAGVSDESLNFGYERIAEIAFSSERKHMSTINQKLLKVYMFTKGAPGCVLERCKYVEKNGKITQLTSKEMANINTAFESFSSQSLRVLALAYKPMKFKAHFDKNDEKNLIFLGLAGIEDPPREGINESIAACRKAGIKTVMITGDHLTTATAIAREIGLINGSELVMDGAELDKISDTEFLSVVEKVAVYARATAEHKLRIIDALEKKGHVVAMTGDGINDAIALRKAHVGISMGQKGTDVAKEASDITLLDDNFNTIVAAVKEGRTTYDNLRTAIHFVLSITTAEMGVIIVAILLGIPLPITAIMVLFINLVTDDFPAMGMSMDAPKKDIMNRNPRKKGELLIDRHALISMLSVGTILTFATLGIFALNYYYLGAGMTKSQTLAFASLMAMEILYAYGIRMHGGQREIGHMFSNKYLNATVVLASLAAIVSIQHPALQSFFGTMAITSTEALKVILDSAAVIGTIVLAREIRERHHSAAFLELENIKLAVAKPS